MHRVRHLIVLFALAMCVSPGAAAAQESTTGSIAGEVRDTQGAAVPGATVTVGWMGGTRTLVTDSQGGFFAPFLTPGSYGVSVELTGFSPASRANVLVRLGARVQLDFTLSVSDLQEELVATSACCALRRRVAI